MTDCHFRRTGKWSCLKGVCHGTCLDLLCNLNASLYRGHSWWKVRPSSPSSLDLCGLDSWVLSVPPVISRNGHGRWPSLRDRVYKGSAPAMFITLSGNRKVVVNSRGRPRRHKIVGSPRKRQLVSAALVILSALQLQGCRSECQTDRTSGYFGNKHRQRGHHAPWCRLITSAVGINGKKMYM